MFLKRKLSMPYWCVANPVGDPFGPGVMERISSLEVTDILCGAKKDGLIEFTSAHDDDLVNWDPYHENDDGDVNSKTYQTLKKIKDKLARAKLGFKMITCDLHGNTVFRNGGISNPDPRIRILAAKKVMRALRIGNLLGAEYFTYWVARDGFETRGNGAHFGHHGSHSTDIGDDIHPPWAHIRASLARGAGKRQFSDSNPSGPSCPRRCTHLMLNCSDASPGTRRYGQVPVQRPHCIHQ